LYVPDLKIRDGEITMILGRSGSGKSTLLETLGLMTNSLAKFKEPYLILDECEGHKDTMLSQSETRLAFHGSPAVGDLDFFAESVEKLPQWSPKNNGKDVRSIWGSRAKEQRHGLRLNHFAFIFQSTNLMDNFTTEENVAIAEMASKTVVASDDNTQRECMDNARETLDHIGIANNRFDSKVKELSGGERQRVAFARAMNAGFTVVFGDEPTGNLDEDNSQRLMKVFQDTIKESTGNMKKSAIIVSHNISLSLKFADRIVLIDTHPYRMKDLVVAQSIPNHRHKRDDTVNLYGKIDANVEYFSRTIDSDTKSTGHSKQWYKKQGEEPEVKVSLQEMNEILKDTLSPKDHKI